MNCILKTFRINIYWLLLFFHVNASAQPLNSNLDKEKWDRVDYPYLMNTFFTTLPKVHQWGDDNMGDLSQFPIGFFQDHIQVVNFWVSKNRKKYKAQIKYVTHLSLDTLNLKNYNLWDSVNYSWYKPIIAPAGMRIIKKVRNDSTFVFPYYWEPAFDLKRTQIDSLYRIKPPNGNYVCDAPSCYCRPIYVVGYLNNKNENSFKPIKKLMNVIAPEDTFTIIDHFDDRSSYFQINDIRWQPNSTYQIERDNFIDKIYFSPLAGSSSSNSYAGHDTLKIGLQNIHMNSEIKLTQRYSYSGIVEPTFMNAISSNNAIKVSFSGNHLVKNQQYLLNITIAPSQLKFKKNNKEIVKIKLQFTEGLLHETVLVIQKWDR